ncbi:ATP-binding cassette domain-containing protein [Lacticaseibacillus pabuli]|uniref:ATP-binding cassette domain-containing protein n=1 Tax=Lacticaseibacillus pabuli TaxID=3025672 RepID=A0ABY7WNP9_9LACO|nr:ATP-binding cassette domain-containing protein [Lacticaseibacillus sp. KACC 23028]WDF81751.1 ATP-binding cassette domain-containing protein [Lacticaseibacillus sp. KACC 23028]
MSAETVVSFKDVDVVFKEKKKEAVHAVDHVSLDVQRGDIYGIVGYSGAGKSTLVRIINLLQRPTSGSVTVLGDDMASLSAGQLRDKRRKIGMIFQHFNLMGSRTIADNIGFPLRGIKSKAEIKAKVDELLDLVGLSDRADAYPAELSGGQKQRVGIARALASDPELLISDEATSALDPKTTASILNLLKELNEKLGLTIVLITHQMEAVKQICSRVAVMDGGAVIERGSLLDIFAHPQQQLTKDFIDTTMQLDATLDTIAKQPAVQHLSDTERLIRLTYLGDTTDQPIIATLLREYHVVANILFADIQSLQDTPFGNLIIIVTGDSDNIDAALKYLSDSGVNVQPVTIPGGAK